MLKNDVTLEQIRKLGHCLVTGGGGFLGRHLVRQLLELGAPVRVLGRRKYPFLEEAGAECIQGDLAEDGVADRACRGIQTVFHTASLCSMWGPREEIYRVNVKGTAQVVGACLQNKCPRLIYTSSPSVVIGRENIVRAREQELDYLDSYLADYPATKMEAEKMVLKADGWEMVPNTPEDDRPALGGKNVSVLRTCALRPHLIWGEDDPHMLPRIYESAEKGRLCQIGDGTNEVTITHVENAAWAHVLAALELSGRQRCGGRAYFVGDDPPVLLWPWIRQALDRMQARPLRPFHLGTGPASLLAGIAEKIRRLLPGKSEPILTRFVVHQLSHSHSFNLAAARRDFSYEMIVSPEEGLRRLEKMNHRK